MHTIQFDSLFAPIINDLGYELYGCEFVSHGRRALLRIYIDSERGIGLEDCQQVSRQLSAALDVEDPIQGHYDLEISSPGIERPLFTLPHYQRSIGHHIKVETQVPVNGRRRFIGKLLAVKEMSIVILVEDENIEIPFTDIKKANLQYEEA